MDLFLIQSLLSVTCIMLLLSMSFGSVSHEHHVKHMKSDTYRNKDSVISAMWRGGEICFPEKKDLRDAAYYQITDLHNAKAFISTRSLRVTYKKPISNSGKAADEYSSCLTKAHSRLPLSVRHHFFFAG